MLPEYRIPTLATGIALAAVAPLVVWRLRGWLGWGLGSVAWWWGWSRILISFAQPPADLHTRLLVYALVATIASGAASAVLLSARGAWRQVGAGLVLASAVGTIAWYVVDPAFFLAGRIAVINLLFPLTLAGLGAAGVAALLAAGAAGPGMRRHLLWIGSGLLLLPAFRSFQSSLSLALSPFWKSPVGRAEAGLFALVLFLVVIGVAFASRRLRADWAVTAVVVAAGLGAAAASWRGYLPPRTDILLLFWLDGAAAAAAALAFGALSVATPRAASAVAQA